MTRVVFCWMIMAKLRAFLLRCGIQGGGVVSLPLCHDSGSTNLCNQAEKKQNWKGNNITVFISVFHIIWKQLEFKKLSKVSGLKKKSI